MPPRSAQTQTNTQPNMHSTHNPSPITRNPVAEKHTFSSKERDTETGLSYFGARYYSSDLSIWLSVDPMADKYPSLSPYTYCANNPVKLVDPNGEDVIILSSDGQNSYKYVNGNLTNVKTGEKYEGGDDFLDNACEKLNNIGKTKTGGTIINDLQNSGYTVTIFKNDSKSYFNMQDNGGCIGWKQSGDDVPTTGGMLSNGTISLAQELVHAYDHKNGGDMSNKSTYEGLQRCEWIAVYYENAIRQEMFGSNASLRNYYCKDNNSFNAQGNGPNLLGIDNKPRLPNGITPLF